MNFWQIPRFHRGAFLAALLAMLASSHAASSAEWQVIPQGGSRLAIDAPGLDEESSRFNRKKESGNTMELGKWAPKVGQFPRAEIFANILEGNFHWKKAPYGNLRSETSKWNFRNCPGTGALIKRRGDVRSGRYNLGAHSDIIKFSCSSTEN